ncbi:hypothetical protein ACFV84_22900 [Kitasatospora sp. NPDC059811]|uniref:hypothetical protein n=1 Tax=Streptomycetaceae TaxID=2062 RepID=UPI0007AF201D|nr:hypothetical protein [Streptomyces sp. MJM8645]
MRTVIAGDHGQIAPKLARLLAGDATVEEAVSVADGQRGWADLAPERAKGPVTGPGPSLTGSLRGRGR